MARKDVRLMLEEASSRAGCSGAGRRAMLDAALARGDGSSDMVAMAKVWRREARLRGLTLSAASAPRCS